MIKVNLGNNKGNISKPYPKLMQGKNNNSIVLFTSERVGTVLFVGNKNVCLSLGQHEINGTGLI